MCDEQESGGTGGIILPLPLPKDNRFSWLLWAFGAFGPVDCLRLVADVEACRLPDGAGRKVGVWGRDDLPFPPESLGFGSRNPVLMAKKFDPE
jgi:hypothetical protein